jgi:hypothetical protein
VHPPAPAKPQTREAPPRQPEEKKPQ